MLMGSSKGVIAGGEGGGGVVTKGVQFQREHLPGEGGGNRHTDGVCLQTERGYVSINPRPESKLIKCMRSLSSFFVFYPRPRGMAKLFGPITFEED